MPTVAALILGDEILAGTFVDENGPFLASQLRSLGATLRRITVLPDDIDAIAAAVREAVASVDRVITTGGIGPTHDDVTYEAVARGLDRPLERRPELVALLARYGIPQTADALRMATVPAGAVLRPAGRPDDPPLVVVGSVYVFPGVPKLLRRQFPSVAADFSGPAICRACVATPADEVTLAPILRAVVDQWPEVAVGSYPRTEGDRRWVWVTLASRDAAAVDAATRALLAAAPAATRVVSPGEPDGGTLWSTREVG
jgi:molybdenum cofactor synthesis domain-containing protein